MSIEEIVKEIVEDDIVARNFIETWHIISDILASFSKATQLPISIYLKENIVFRSPVDSMPALCQKLLKHPELSYACNQNALERAREKSEKKVKDKNRQIQLCHAGMVNAKREIETGIGTLTILFGYKPAFSPEAMERRKLFIVNVKNFEQELAQEIENIISQDEHQSTISLNNFNLEKDFFDEHDIALIDSITKILKLLLNVTVGFRSLTINMAHELVVMLLGIHHMSLETSETLEEIQDSIPENKTFAETVKLQKYIDSETELGLYLVRNYLSQSSEYRYSQVLKPHFEKLNLKPLINEMIDLYQWRADEKQIKISCELDDLPNIWGDKMELRRCLHNIFSNAIKYSYHSTDESSRNIKISSKVPYDPGFKKRRFAVTFENYGLGLDEEESRMAFTPGFRGKQAIREVATGSGIGLSEVRKIINLHKGEVKFQSKRLYGEGIESTYLTTVSLILPYSEHFKI
jgi:signal transduction histidine kinase